MKQLQLVRKHVFGVVLLTLSLCVNVWAQPTNCPPGFDAPYCDARKNEPLDKLDHTLEKPPLLDNDLMQKVSPSVSLSAYEAADSQLYAVAPQGSRTWGALAKDIRLPGIEGLGIANNRLSVEDAKHDALLMCQQNGGKDCYIEEVFSNRCVGLALSDVQELYWAIGLNADHAGHNAISQCAQKSSALCKLVYRRCSYEVQ